MIIVLIGIPRVGQSAIWKAFSRAKIWQHKHALKAGTFTGSISFCFLLQLLLLERNDRPTNFSCQTFFDLNSKI
jgi:hypothetical protein